MCMLAPSPPHAYFCCVCMSLVDRIASDLGVRVPGKEGLAIGRPGQGGTVGLGGQGVLPLGGPLGLEVVHHLLALQVPDLDALGRGGAEPVAVGGEDQGVDDVAGVQGVEALAFVQVPEHGGAVLAAGGAEGAVGGDSHNVQVARVANEVLLELAVGQIPDLFM